MSEVRLTVRVPRILAARVRKAADDAGLSVNAFAMRCFERFADIPPTRPGDSPMGILPYNDASKFAEAALIALVSVQNGHGKSMPLHVEPSLQFLGSCVRFLSDTSGCSLALGRIPK
jgi:hypothetical protein